MKSTWNWGVGAWGPGGKEMEGRLGQDNEIGRVGGTVRGGRIKICEMQPVTS